METRHQKRVESPPDKNAAKSLLLACMTSDSESCQPAAGLTVRPLFAFACLALCGIASSRAQSVYVMDPLGADFTGMGANGGTIVVPYNLASGTAVAGLGNAFNVTFTVSDLTPFTGGNDYTWLNPTQNANGDGIYTNTIGTEYDIDSLLNNLPSNNRDDFNNPGTSLDQWMRDRLADSDLTALGSFTVTTSAAPTVSGYNITNDVVTLSSNWDMESSGIGNGNLHQGVWAAPIGAPVNPTTSVVSGDLNTTHGGSTLFQFTAFDDLTLGNTITQHDFPFWKASGTLTYEAVPEVSTSMLVVGGSLLILGQGRRRRAA